MTAPWEQRAAAPGALGLPREASGAGPSHGTLAPAFGAAQYSAVLGPEGGSPAAGEPSRKIAKRKYKKGKYRGVRERGQGRWVAEVKDSVTGRRKWLGTFSTAEAAALAFDAAVREIRGPSAKTNFAEGAAPPLSPRSSGTLTSPGSGSSGSLHGFRVDLGPASGLLSSLRASLLTTREQKAAEWQLVPAAQNRAVTSPGPPPLPMAGGADVAEPAVSAPLPVAWHQNSLMAYSPSDSTPSCFNSYVAGLGPHLAVLAVEPASLDPAGMSPRAGMAVAPEAEGCLRASDRAGTSMLAAGEAKPVLTGMADVDMMPMDAANLPSAAQLPVAPSRLNTPKPLSPLAPQRTQLLSAVLKAEPAQRLTPTPRSPFPAGSMIGRDNMDSFERTFATLAAADGDSGRWFKTGSLLGSSSNRFESPRVDPTSGAQPTDVTAPARQPPVTAVLEDAFRDAMSLDIIEGLLMD